MSELILTHRDDTTEYHDVPFLRVGGGAGSGNFGHSGRPGVVGGSTTAQREWEQSLSSTDRQVLQNWTEIAASAGQGESNATLDRIFANAPSYEGMVYRGIGSLESLDELQGVPLTVGQTFTTTEYASASKLKSVAGEFARDDLGVEQEHSAVLLELQTHTGAHDISQLGLEQFRSQQEVILRPGVTYRVTSIGQPSNLQPSRFKGVPNVRVIEIHAEEVPKTLGGVGSGNFGHSGRPGEIGGSSPFVVFHGTSSAALASIKKNGLIPHAGKGGDEYWKMSHGHEFTNSEIRANPTIIGDRKASVYLADTPEHANTFARFATEVNPGSRPVILEVDIPKAVAERVRPDEGFISHGVQTPGAYRFKGPIRPEWIKGQVILSPDKYYFDDAAYTIKALEDTHRIYAIFFVDGDTPTTAGSVTSGNFGHAGRPGHVGGSVAAPSGVLAAIEQADGGFTYHAVTGEQPTTGFALSIHRDREQVMPSDEANVVALANYARKNWDLLSQPNNFLGGWHSPDDGRVYLDVSTVVKTAAEAETMARKAHQLAYFDLVKGQSIKLKYGDEHVHKAAESQPDWTRRWAAYFRRLSRPRQKTDGAGTDRGGNLRSEKDLSPETLGGAGSGNFGHAGRPGDVGGSAPFFEFFHGTSSDALDGIAKNGLVPLAHSGADAAYPTFQQKWQVGDRKSSIYVTDDFYNAQMFADITSQSHPGTTPVILAVDVPREVVSKFVEDEAFHEGDYGAASIVPGHAIKPSAFRFKGTIPPAWISVVDAKSTFLTSTPLTDRLKTLVGGRVFYFVIMCDETQLTTAHSRTPAQNDEDRARALQLPPAQTHARLNADPNGAGTDDLEALGGAGSGNFSHSGRPGKVGGSSTTGTVDFTALTNGESETLAMAIHTQGTALMNESFHGPQDHETLTFLNVYTGAPLIKEPLKGNLTGVDMPEDQLDFFKQLPPQSVLSMHTHPSSTPFSHADLMTTLETKGAGAIVLGKDGTAYELKLTGKINRATQEDIDVSFRDMAGAARDTAVRDTDTWASKTFHIPLEDFDRLGRERIQQGHPEIAAYHAQRWKEVTTELWKDLARQNRDVLQFRVIPPVKTT